MGPLGCSGAISEKKWPLTACKICSKLPIEDLIMEHSRRASGFASMDQRKQREIARKGGTAAHRKGTAHEFTTEEARYAGRKGGQQVSANRNHMIEIGRLGGRRSAESRRNRASAPQQPPVEVTTSVPENQTEEPATQPQ
jgi:general stress protein YciG